MSGDRSARRGGEPADLPPTGTLRRLDLAHRIRGLGFSQREAIDLVGGFFDLLGEALGRGEAARLSGFGRFEVVTRKPRVGRNLATGEAVRVAARRTVVFRPSGGLRDALTQALATEETGGKP